MTKAEYLAICLSKWEEMKQLGSCNTLYDLEKELHEVCDGIGRDLLEKQLGDVPMDRRKKKPKKQLRKN
jgi:hypothetical protein